MSYRPFLFTGDPNYPSGYAGSLVNATPPLPTYAAMGDSFSSGEGNPPFEIGTDTSSDSCHRSPQAYPRLLELDSSLNLGSTAFVACSGAMTSNVTGGQNGEPTQTSAITADTKVITITVGGDDIGFADYAAGCYAGPCGPGTPSYSGIMAAAGSQALVTRLESTYEAILAKATNPGVQIYVVDYPYIAPDGAGMCAGFDVSGAYSIESMLNLAIEQSVAEVGDSKLHYVNTNAPGSPFDGRSLCSSNDSDFNGLKYPFVYSLHPNAQGQQDYATVVKDYIQLH
ncbi:MAG TPA: SGNH/GDSL hydrolase family protein [Candidatus Saccharimonadaceae bacterium]|nr:SGNH/GDSL hydrolase family protein [Candidatus Saccharimonadaceae bacterium]